MIKELNTDLKKNAIGQLSCMKFKEQLDKASLDIEKFLTDTSGKLEVDQRGYNEYVQAIKTNFDNIFSQT
uniref:Uncharacterized protein n=1 Tax=Acrobeloides nanus TaxID=290746 RepID=A0A914CZF3_9BILA